MQVTNVTPSATTPTAAPAPAAEPKTVQEVQKPAADPAAPADPAKANEPAKDPAKDPAQDKLSPRFAALAREERRVQELRENAKREREALEKSEEYQAFQEFKKTRETAKTDPFGHLKTLGLSYDELTKIALNNGKLTYEQRVALLEREREEEKAAAKSKAEEEKAAQERKAAEEAQKKIDDEINAFVGTIETFLGENSERFELTKSHPEGKELVYNVIERHHAEHGRILSHEEAAAAVEGYLEEEAMKFASAKKIKTKLGVKDDPAPVDQAPKADPTPSSPKTLMNSIDATVPTPVDRELTPEEARAKAIAMIKWKTKTT